MSEIQNGALPKGGALSTLLDNTLTAMNTLGSLIVFLMMIMVDVDAFSRTLFNHPFHGVTELVELSIVGIVFLQLGDATRQGRLTRSDGFFNIMKARKPKFANFMGVIFDFLGVIFFAIVLWGAVPELRDAWVNDYFVGEEGLFTVPEWPIKVIIVLGCFVTMLHFIRMGMQYLGWFGGSASEPNNPAD